MTTERIWRDAETLGQRNRKLASLISGRLHDDIDFEHLALTSEVCDSIAELVVECIDKLGYILGRLDCPL